MLPHVWLHLRSCSQHFLGMKKKTFRASPAFQPGKAGSLRRNSLPAHRSNARADSLDKQPAGSACRQQQPLETQFEKCSESVWSGR